MELPSKTRTEGKIEGRGRGERKCKQLMDDLNTLRTGAFKLFKCTFPGPKQFKSNLYCVSLKIYNRFANYFCELKFSRNTHQRP